MGRYAKSGDGHQCESRRCSGHEHTLQTKTVLSSTSVPYVLIAAHENSHTSITFNQWLRLQAGKVGTYISKGFSALLKGSK